MKDSAEAIHSITQEMSTLPKGWEGHVVCKEGKGMTHTAKEVRLDDKDEAIFTKDIVDGVYPFVVRMVKNFVFSVFDAYRTSTILMF